jgi:hypothetical protein
MADDSVGGLFGVNPEMYQQQQQQQVFNRAVALQNLNPFQQAAVGMQQAGYNLAGALGGALGGVDPQLQRISTLNAISKQIDQTNPESMLRGAKLLADAGFTQEALGLANYARKANSELALAQQRQREGAVASTDAIKNATALADVSGFAKGTPAYNNVYKEALTGLTAKPGKTDSIFANINPSDYTPESIKAFVVSNNYGDLVPKAAKTDSLVSAINPNDFTPASLAAFKLSSNYADLVPKSGKTDNLISAVNPNDYTPASIAAFKLSSNYADLVLRPEKTAAADKANIKEIGVSAKGDAVYLDVNKDEQFTFKIEDGKTVRVPYAGSVDRTTSKVSATATSIPAKQQGAFAESRGKDQAASLRDAAANALSASQALKTISTMKQLDQTGQLVTGPLANSYVGASNLLASIGLLSKNQISILTSSQVYDKSAKDLVMQDLGGKLGAQISDADRKFVEDRIPQLTTSAKARTELLEKIEEIQRGKITYYKKMEKYANKEGDLNGFDFSEVYTVTPPVGSPAASSVKSKADAIIKGNP